MRVTRKTLRNRGQTLVLACVALFILGLMTMLSFSLVNAIHERIRIQNHADAAAYSVAIVEARTFNVIAYSNRAIAATMVSMMAVHAWMAIASQEVSILQAGIIDMGEVIAMEVAMGCYPYNVSHCPCIPPAIDSMMNYMDQKDNFEQKVQGKESDFNDVIESFYKALKNLYKMQNDSIETAMGEIGSPGSVLNALKNKNAPQSSYAGLEANTGEMGCALENTKKEYTCSPLVGNGREKEKPGDGSVLTKIAQNAGDAAREDFEQSFMIMSAHSDFYPSSNFLRSDIQGGNGQAIPFFSGSAGAGNSGNSDPGSDDSAQAVSASTSGMHSVITHKHGSGVMSTSSQIYSDKNGGDHSPAHQDTHDKYKGVALEEGGDVGNFVNFVGDSNPDSDFGCPSTWAGVKQDLSMMRGGNHGPWEINGDATVKVKYGESGETELKMRPETGYAIAKGKAYYHQLNKWKNQPTFFNPFWRAKLHFMSRQEMEAFAGKVGDSDGATIAGSGPVEGVQ